MAKESSFDIVSELDFQEVDNALNQALREAGNRYDLKNAGCKIEYDKNQNQLVLSSSDDFSLKSVKDIVLSKIIRRGIDVKALMLNQPEPASGGRVKQDGRFIEGISMDIARDLNKRLKQSKLKINVQIQGDKMRVSSKSKDDLQEAIALVKKEELEIPVQFKNFR